VEYTIPGLFLTGVALGASQCTLTCGPILGLYVAGTKNGWKNGLKATLTFSLSRLSAYVILGYIAGLSSAFVTNTLSNDNFSFYVWIVAGSLITLLGTLIILGKEPHLKLCHLVGKHCFGDGNESMALLGFIMGITPCAPLLGVLTYIALTAKGPLMGAFYSLCFGIGPAVVTPIILVGILAGVVPSAVFKTPKTYQVFRRMCGALLLFYGIRLIIQVL
jgi:sulfite exporter TauE/SafE